MDVLNVPNLTITIRQGVSIMPNWLQNQIKKAFYEKNSYQVKLLNQCWYYYRRKNTPS